MIISLSVEDIVVMLVDDEEEDDDEEADSSDDEDSWLLELEPSLDSVELLELDELELELELDELELDEVSVLWVMVSSSDKWRVSLTLVQTELWKRKWILVYNSELVERWNFVMRVCSIVCKTSWLQVVDCNNEKISVLISYVIPSIVSILVVTDSVIFDQNEDSKEVTRVDLVSLNSVTYSNDHPRLVIDA